MSILASGSILLSAIDDAYSATITPNNCVINSSYDGGDVDLDNAFYDIRIFRGGVPEAFSISFDSSSNAGLTYSVTNIDTLVKRVRITGIPDGITSGWLTFVITSAITSHVMFVTLDFTVVREATMLDWILDWDSNKTEIGGTYLITPKIFVGKRIGDDDDIDSLCGVYIGPDGLGDGSSGIYGLRFGEEIFKLNKDGGKIGSWKIGTEHLYSSHVLLGSNESYIGVSPFELTDQLVSSQNFSHRDKIHEHGGVAMFYSESNDFGLEGYLPSTEQGGVLTLNKIFSLGSTNKIASWNFDTDSLWIGNKSNVSGHGTQNAGSITIGSNGIRGFGWYIDAGGNASFANGNAFFGNSSSRISAWNVDNEAIYTGTKALSGFTSSSGYVTLSSSGVRGYKWKLESSGEAVFSGGFVSFNADGSGSLANGNIVWDASGTSLELAGAIFVKNSNNVIKAGMLATGSGSAGIRFFAGSSTPSSAPFRVDENGLMTATNAVVTGQINASAGSIGCWTIDSNSIFTGTKTTTGFTPSSGHITIGTTGLRGYKWRIESNGVAAFANGNVVFNADGSGSVANGLVGWTSNGTLTIGGTNGTTLQNDMVLTGGIKVKKNGVVKAGMLSDGSGTSGIRFFAGSSTPSSAPFRVDENGLMTATNAVITGQINASSGYIGNWIINTPENGGTIVSDNGGTPKVTLDASGSIRLYTNNIDSCIEHMVCGGEGYSRGIGSDINLNANSGVIKINTVGDVSGGIGSVLLTPTGIYADRAGMETPNTDSNITQRAAIVGDGKSTLVSSAYSISSDENCVIGVYGSASNTRVSSAAPCYGGYFDGLKVRGLYLGRKVITSTGSHQLEENDTLVIVMPPVNGATSNIYLPTEGAHEGRTVIVKLINNGDSVVHPGAGSYMNTTSNTAGVPIGNGETWIFILIKIPVSAGVGSVSGYHDVWTSMKANNQ